MSILVALGLRLASLTLQPLWWDEGWSVYFATTDLGSLFKLTAVDIHPPLYYMLLHLWIEFLGSSAFSIKLLSALIGTATVPLLFVTGRRLFGGASGLLAAGFLAISPFHIYYSQEVRMYALVTLLSLAAFDFALRWRLASGERISEAKHWGLGLAYVLAATLALYTQYYSAFVLLALNASMLICWLRGRRGVRRILPWLGAQATVALLYLPWLWYAGGKLVSYVRFKVSVEGDPALSFLAYVSRYLSAFNWGHSEGLLASQWYLGLLPLLLLLISGMLLLLRRANQEGLGHALSRARTWVMVVGHWPLAIVLIALLCGFFVNLAFPFNPPRSERLLLLALPAYLLLVAAALRGLWRERRWLAVLPAASFVIVGILSLALFYTVPRYPDDDYRPLAARVRALALPTDAIVAVHPWQVGYLRAYIPEDDARPSLVLTPRQVLPRERQLWADDPELMAAELDDLLAENGRVWLLDHQAMARVLERQIEAFLVERAYPTLSEWYGDNTVLSLFAAGEQSALPVSAQFGEWLELEGAALNRAPVQAGWGSVTTDLAWRLLDRPRERYHVGLRLVDGAGRVWAQRDSNPAGGLQHFFEWPVGESIEDRHALLVPAGTPPGEYDVTLRVYRSKDLEVLPATFEGGSGGEATLGTVQVTRPESQLPVEALTVDNRLLADFDNRLRLLGFSVDTGAAFRPGEAVKVELFWQALGDPGQDFFPQLQLLDAQGSSVALLTEKPVAGTYPTAWWRSGDLVRDPHALPIPATVPAGSYRLTLGLIRAADGLLVETQDGSTAIDLGHIEILDREHLYWPTFPAHFQQAQFGPSVELIGYDMREVVRAPGSPLEVTLHWHALETPDKGYHSFVHLLDEEEEIVVQHDGPPGEGELPTLGWLPSEYFTDTHLLQLPLDLDDGIYRLGVGLYDPATGQRLGERLMLNSPVPLEANGGCNCR
jgi:4-amino-4-deoxy-L-arabinose transferase-like glycosyltransferase